MKTMEVGGKMKKIIVCFPGIGYHCDKPLLYYSCKITKELEYSDIIQIKYSFNGTNIKGNAKKMKEAFDSLYQQAKNQLACVEWDRYTDVVFISKSIGTVIACAFALEQKINCRNILYTPLEQTYKYLKTDGEGIAFIGTADPWSDVEKVIHTSKNKNIPIYIYERANHSLEVEDTLDNIKIIADVMKKTKKYLDNLNF